MPRPYTGRPRLCRPFIVTSYSPDAEGRLVAAMPGHCPLSGSTPKQRCQLRIDHHRRRKTGPEHPLAVVRCQTHDCRFTLYPSGFAPYRRQPVLRMGPDGEPTPGDSGRDEFADTLFEAAIDARVGRAWARDTVDEDDPPDRWWGTQGRHLALAARLVGIAKDLADSVRERIAAALQVGTLVLREHSAARGFRAIGAAVCDVFGRLRARSRRAEQLLLCGHLTEHWGEPWRWDATRRRMERSPFLCKGTAVGSSP